MLKLDGLNKSAWYIVTINKQEVRLHIKSITRTDYLKAEKEYQSYKFVKHQKIKVIDEEVKDRYFRKMLADIIIGWEGIDMECNPENIKLFIKNYAGYIVRTDEVDGIDEKISLIQDIQQFSGEVNNFIQEDTENLVTT